MANRRDAYVTGAIPLLGARAGITGTLHGRFLLARLGFTGGSYVSNLPSSSSPTRTDTLARRCWFLVVKASSRSCRLGFFGAVRAPSATCRDGHSRGLAFADQHAFVSQPSSAPAGSSRSVLGPATSRAVYKRRSFSVTALEPLAPPLRRLVGRRWVRGDFLAFDDDRSTPCSSRIAPPITPLDGS